MEKKVESRLEIRQRRVITVMTRFCAISRPLFTFSDMGLGFFHAIEGHEKH